MGQIGELVVRNVLSFGSDLHKLRANLTLYVMVL